jgi:3-phosphoshikimate 1-carboxyvinyltransferase
MISLPPVLPIVPFTKPARGEVTLPGSKSITNRALLLAALCDGPVTLTGALFSEDTEIMAEALRQLGFVVKEDESKKTIYVEGRGGEIPAKEATLHVGLAGTAARFLTALCAAAKSGVYRLDGVPQMRKRPMKGLIDALRSLGADIRCTGEEGFFPLEIHARGLGGGKVEIDASESSQMLSGLLMVAPLAQQPVRVLFNWKLRWPFVGMTCELMKKFGRAAMTVPENPVQALDVPTGIYHLHTDAYSIEPDATAASYFAALPLATSGKLTLLNLKHGLQGDTQFAEVLKRIGLTGISDSPKGLVVESGPQYTGIGVTENFNEFSDTFLTLTAITPLLRGLTCISGIAHSRKQETDRVAGAARELIKLGQGVVEEHDSLTITPNLAELKKRAAQGLIEIETYGDHRFAMSFAILGSHDLLGNGRPWLAIKNPACCAKTFPNFFDVLAEVWKTSHAVPPPASP